MSLFGFFAACVISVFVIADLGQSDVNFFERKLKKTCRGEARISDKAGSIERVIEIYEQSSGNAVYANGKKYYDYMLSLDPKHRHGVLLRQANSRIYAIPFDESSGPDAEERIFLDLSLNQRESKIDGHGLFSNTVFYLDSLKEKAKDRVAYVSAKRIFDVSDQIYILKMRLSLKKGMEEISVVDGQAFGDTVICKCN